MFLLEANWSAKSLFLLDQISAYMKTQFDLNASRKILFLERDETKAGESIQELASKICQAAATCDFA